ncbi:MAG: S-layer homology domain-containing protein, partial [Moorea sp. SIO4G2]|nr:S-layer homology domain-containing protein [Moorena sp. SIO4G2]
SQGTQFAPNQTISRRQYARWLMDANNRIYANRPGLQIRLASNTTQPAFQDVPRTDPDFPYIQGLADAGLIPSPLSGDSTAVLFRPNAPLTREKLMLWKVPLDTRKALPKASIEAVKETWGFKDTAEIDPKALRAVLADFRNGDLANIRRVFGYTILFQPKKPVTRAEAAAALWYFGSQGEGQSAKEALFIKPQTSQPSGAPKATPSN